MTLAPDPLTAAEARKLERRLERGRGEQAFLQALAQFAPDLPEPDRQCQVIVGRRFTTDYGYRRAKLAIEIDGGEFIPGARHWTDYDRERQNLLVLDGWRVLRFSTTQLRDDPARCIAQVRRALAGSGPEEYR